MPARHELTLTGREILRRLAMLDNVELVVRNGGDPAAQVRAIRQILEVEEVRHDTKPETESDSRRAAA